MLNAAIAAVQAEATVDVDADGVGDIAGWDISGFVVWNLDQQRFDVHGLKVLGTRILAVDAELDWLCGGELATKKDREEADEALISAARKAQPTLSICVACPEASADARNWKQATGKDWLCDHCRAAASDARAA